MGGKRFISDLSPEEWEKRRKSILNPGLSYWIMLFFILFTATLVLVLNLVTRDSGNPLTDILWAVGVGLLWLLLYKAAARKIFHKPRRK